MAKDYKSTTFDYSRLSISYNFYLRMALLAASHPSNMMSTNSELSPIINTAMTMGTTVAKQVLLC